MFVMINKNGGGGGTIFRFYGGHRAHGIPPVTGETPESKLESEPHCIKGTLS